MRNRRPGVRLGVPHRWQTHGGYSLLRAVTKGNLDGRVAAAQAVKAICHQLARDLGSTWEDLSAQRRMLCESVAAKATILSLMVGYSLGGEVMAEDGTLRAPLGKHFLAWSNSMRLDLQALGLERTPKQALDLAGYVAQRYGNAKGGSPMPPTSRETQPGRAGGPGDGPVSAEAAE